METELRAIHTQVKQWLLEHQDALVGAELLRADLLLRQFINTMRQHIAMENERLLPRYADLGAPFDRGGDPVLFFTEHDRILYLMESMQEQSAAIVLLDDGSPRRRRVVELLAEETKLLALLEHHEMREETLLCRRLEHYISDLDQKRILKALQVKPT